MENPIISVIIPVYNVEKYLKRCLDSVLNQTYSSLEIILIDDGSKDNSGKICDEYAQRDHRIITIHKDNGGLSDARNVGIENMRGQYVTFIDSDDYVAADYVDYLYRLLIEYNVEISMCHYKKVYSEKEPFDIKSMSVELLDSKCAMEYYLYHKKFTASAYCKMYKRNLFDSIRYPVGKYYEDMAVICQLLDSANQVAIGNQQKYYYLQRESSIMRENFSVKKMHRIEIAEKNRRFVLQKYPDLIKAANARCFLAAVQTYREIPLKREYKGYVDLVWKEIKKYRKEVITDSNVKMFHRVIAMSTFLGKSCLHIIGKWYGNAINIIHR